MPDDATIDLERRALQQACVRIERWLAQLDAEERHP